jgi:hypothetical protein
MFIFIIIIVTFFLQITDNRHITDNIIYYYSSVVVQHVFTDRNCSSVFMTTYTCAMHVCVKL